MDNQRPIAARKRMVAAGGLDPSSPPKTEFPLTAQSIPSRSCTTAPVGGQTNAWSAIGALLLHHTVDDGLVRQE